MCLVVVKTNDSGIIGRALRFRLNWEKMGFQRELGFKKIKLCFVQLIMQDLEWSNEEEY